MITLKFQACQLALGATPRTLLEKFSAIQMVDVNLPSTDSRHLILPRFTQAGPDQQLECQSALCYKTHAVFYTL